MRDRKIKEDKMNVIKRTQEVVYQLGESNMSQSVRVSPKRGIIKREKSQQRKRVGWEVQGDTNQDREQTETNKKVMEDEKVEDEVHV